MPTSETLSRVKNVIRTCLKADPRASFDDQMPLVGGEYDLDSLDILLIVTELEKEFGVRITEGQLSKAVFTNIQTLAEFIEQLQSSQ